jgi:hypothetical protein
MNGPLVSRLSPLNFRGLIATLRAGLQPTPQAAARAAYRPRPRQVWLCPECGDSHDWEDEASECCAPNALAEVAESPGHCPICRADNYGPYEAADCCLWKDIDAPTRWRIAAAVHAGATWAEALGQERKAIPA